MILLRNVFDQCGVSEYSFLLRHVVTSAAQGTRHSEAAFFSLCSVVYMCMMCVPTVPIIYCTFDTFANDTLYPFYFNFLVFCAECARLSSELCDLHLSIATIFPLRSKYSSYQPYDFLNFFVRHKFKHPPHSW